MTIQQDPHALALIATLEAGDVQVGDHHAPHEVKPTEDTWTPYVILFMLPGGELGGSLGDPEAYGDLRFQTMAVGRHPAEARTQADLAKAALTGPVTVAGRAVMRVRPIEASNGMQRDDAVTPPLFYVVARYGALTYPA